MIEQQIPKQYEQVNLWRITGWVSPSKLQFGACDILGTTRQYYALLFVQLILLHANRIPNIYRLDTLLHIYNPSYHDLHLTALEQVQRISSTYFQNKIYLFTHWHHYRTQMMFFHHNTKVLLFEWNVLIELLLNHDSRSINYHQLQDMATSMTKDLLIMAPGATIFYIFATGRH